MPNPPNRLRGFVSATYLADTLVERLGDENSIRLLLAGPAGVGKTELARAITSTRPDVRHIEHDALKRVRESCSSQCFDPQACFSPELLSLERFVIDMGGGLVFRGNADNEARLRKMIEFKGEYSLAVVLLTASRSVVRQRYLSCKEGTSSGFEQDWPDWEMVERPWWQRCADFEFDVS